MSRVLRRMGERRRSASVFTAFPRVKGLPVEPLGINFAARGACLQCFVSDVRETKVYERLDGAIRCIFNCCSNHSVPRDC